MGERDVADEQIGTTSAPTLRRAVYVLLALLAVATICGRISSVKSRTGRSPLLSANDRSRWSMIRALVDHGTFQIDQVIFRRDGRRDREWYTIDMVRHRGRDGREHYYSSKPPLFATLVAAKYWILKQTSGVTLASQPFYVVRALLMATNVVPLVLYFAILAVLVERLGRTDWGRIVVMATATFGTFLTTFAVTLNNHLPAAICVLLAVYCALRVFRDGCREYRYFVIAGLCAAFAVANELPALSFCALLGGVFLITFPRQALLGYAPAVAVVAAAFFATNIVAHDSWRPPYAHRSDGPIEGQVSRTDWSPVAGDAEVSLPPELRESFPVPISDQAVIRPSAVEDRWVVWDSEQQRRWALVPDPSGDVFQVRGWDNWYEYENTYWSDERRSGVDRGEPSRAVYAFHMLLGHRGIFSLTPMWLLSVVGIGIWFVRGDRTLRGLAACVTLLTVVCLTFYIMRPLVDRNYGGVACGFRWMFWFIPLWLLTAIPAADAVAGCRKRRAVVLLLLAVSVFSATYAAQNPWSQPWIYDYWTHLGWI